MNISFITGSSCLLFLKLPVNGASGSSASTSPNGDHSSSKNGYEVPSGFTLGGLSLALSLDNEFHQNREKLLRVHNVRLRTSLSSFLFQMECGDGNFFDEYGRHVIRNGELTRCCYDIGEIPILRHNPANKTDMYYYKYLVEKCVTDINDEDLTDEQIKILLTNIEKAKGTTEIKMCSACTREKCLAERQYREKERFRRFLKKQDRVRDTWLREREQWLEELKLKIKALTEEFDKRDKTYLNAFKFKGSEPKSRPRAHTIDESKLVRIGLLNLEENKPTELRKPKSAGVRKRADSCPFRR